MIEVGCRNCGNIRDINKKCKYCTEDDDLNMTEKEFIKYDLLDREHTLKSNIYQLKENVNQKDIFSYDEEHQDFIDHLKMTIFLQKKQIEEIKNYIEE